MSAKNKRPSPKTSRKASKVLSDDRYSANAKSSAGYALGDTPSKRGGKASAKKSSAKGGKKSPKRGKS
jgi:hypothetical protein